MRSIAVMFLFSFVNPAHERRAAEIVREEFPDVEHVSLSHEVMARGPEFERVSTTLVNAYVAPRIAAYVGHLQEKLRGAGYGGPLLIMQSTGGVMPPDYVAQRAVTLLASGPTGGVMGATLAASKAGVDDFVAVDMGGTSFDLCLVRDGRPEIKTDWNWRYRYYIGLPMVDVQSVGAGGGSIARVRQGALLVGPESGGLDPRARSATAGAASARRSPTPTPCSGTSRPTGFAGGRMTLDVDAARAAIEREVAEPLGIDVIEAAWGIERIVNANMANATRRVLAVARRRPARPRAHRLRRQRRRCTRGRSPPSSASTGSSCRRRRRRSRRSACSSPTTSSTWCARTSSRSRRSTWTRCARSWASSTRGAKELEPTGLAARRTSSSSSSRRCATRARTST